MTADKRDECGCHKGCVTYPHECEKKCVWPDCLTEAEHAELSADLERDWNEGLC
jgi:hypothetical protein